MKRAACFIFFIFVAIFLVSGCAGKEKAAETGTSLPSTTEPKTQETVKTTCDDDNACTTDVFNALTKTCEYKIIENCCGNKRCEETERCDAVMHRTNCIPDCTLLCPAFLIIHTTETGITSDDFSYSNYGDGLEQLDENDFATTGKNSKMGIKTVLTNLGERSTKLITSTFYCQELEVIENVRQQANFDGETIRGIKFTDYFGNNLQDLELNSAAAGNNSVTYYLNFDTTGILNSTKVRCVITIQSEDFRNQQDVLIDFFKPAA